MQRKLKPSVIQAQIGSPPATNAVTAGYCPRFLLGYAVEPHQVMRSLAFTRPVRSNGTNGQRSVVRAAFAPCTPARRTSSRRKPATTRRASCDAKT
jgi:hypothetical protein